MRSKSSLSQLSCHKINGNGLNSRVKSTSLTVLLGLSLCLNALAQNSDSKASGGTALQAQSSPASVAAISSPKPTPFKPTLTPFETGEKSKLRIYLLMGQSNMVGRDISTIGKQTTDPRIGYMNKEGQWFVAIEPMHEGGTGIGPGIPFAREMLKNDPNGKIGLIPTAVGGTPLSRWEKGCIHYEEALRRAKAAMSAGVLAGVLWHQGETDSDIAETAASYEMRLTEMFKALREDLGCPNLPIVVGQLGDFDEIPYVHVVKHSLARVPRDLPMVGFADSKGLVDRGDRLHFTADSQEQLGQRYAAAMLKLQQAAKK